MNEHVIDDGVARRFLLGQLSLEEQGRIEALAFADADIFAFLQAAENDLMDEFLCGELSSEERESFEKHFLAGPGRRRDLRIARALKQYLDQDDQPSEVVPNTVIDSGRNSFFQRLGLDVVTGPLAAAAVIILAIAVIVFVIRAIRRDEPPPLQAQQQQATPIPTPSSSATPIATTPTPVQKETPAKPAPSPRQPAGPLYAVVLTPGAPPRSDTDDIVLSFPSGAAQFELPIFRETAYPSYQALLQKDEQTIRSWDKLRLRKMQSGKAVVITVLPGVFEKSQRYRIVLNGVSSRGKVQQLHTYHFRISDTETR